MATIKLTIDARRPYNDGRCPIVFRLTSGTKSTSIPSGVKLFPKDWDRIKLKILKTHPDYRDLNLLLKEKLFKLEEKLLKVTATGDEKDISELKEALLKEETRNKVKFKSFAENEIRNLRDQGRFGNAQSYETAVNRLLKFAGEEINLDQIDFTLLSDFDTDLIKNKLSRNSVAVYMREIRALMNKAIHKKLLEPNQYPFNSYKIKTEKTVSRAVNKNTLKELWKVQLKDHTPLWHSRNIFFLIFNLIGISFIDLALLTSENLQGDRIIYRRRKTGKMYSIKLTAEALRIISLYKKENSKYLISLFKLDFIPIERERQEVGLRLQTCNKWLKKLGRQCKIPIPLTTYVARYSWANIAKSLGFPKDQIAEALGHEYGNRITGIYLDNYGSELIDEMNRKVTGDS
ncbi:MAG: hypothetical protein K0Q95_2091 [Bacteroidota bacterium]|nr:hypothetical protein [Bacteroidota bacterium]